MIWLTIGVAFLGICVLLAGAMIAAKIQEFTQTHSRISKEYLDAAKAQQMREMH